MTDDELEQFRDHLRKARDPEPEGTDHPSTILAAWAFAEGTTDADRDKLVAAYRDEIGELPTELERQFPGA